MCLRQGRRPQNTGTEVEECCRRLDEHAFAVDRVFPRFGAVRTTADHV
ncbi:hypothetical protein [Streptomyces lavendulae]|nr:hypothetical protein [Streptomyces lavendulae]